MNYENNVPNFGATYSPYVSPIPLRASSLIPTYGTSNDNILTGSPNGPSYVMVSYIYGNGLTMS